MNTITFRRGEPCQGLRLGHGFDTPRPLAFCEVCQHYIADGQPTVYPVITRDAGNRVQCLCFQRVEEKPE